MFFVVSLIAFFLFFIYFVIICPVPLLTPPRKHRVCAVLLSSVPFSFCTRLYVLSVCFASQTPGLCSASIFGSLPLLHTFICFVSVLRLANTGFVLRFPFAHVCLCQCASPRKHRVCAVLFPPSLINLFAFKLCLYFTIDFVLCIFNFALQASRLLGPKLKFLFGVVVF